MFGKLHQDEDIDLDKHHVDVHQSSDRNSNHGSTIQDKNSNLQWNSISDSKKPWGTFMMTVAVKSESAMFSIIQAPT